MGPSVCVGCMTETKENIGIDTKFITTYHCDRWTDRGDEAGVGEQYVRLFMDYRQRMAKSGWPIAKFSI